MLCKLCLMMEKWLPKHVAKLRATNTFKKLVMRRTEKIDIFN